MKLSAIRKLNLSTWLIKCIYAHTIRKTILEYLCLWQNWKFIELPSKNYCVYTPVAAVLYLLRKFIVVGDFFAAIIYIRP